MVIDGISYEIAGPSDQLPHGEYFQFPATNPFGVFNGLLYDGYAWDHSLQFDVFASTFSGYDGGPLTLADMWRLPAYASDPSEWMTAYGEPRMFLPVSARGGCLNCWYGATFAPEPVPEPSTLLLFSTGVVGLVGCLWRRKQRMEVSP
jgi:hypothetical protein